MENVEKQLKALKNSMDKSLRDFKKSLDQVLPMAMEIKESLEKLNSVNINIKSMFASPAMVDEYPNINKDTIEHSPHYANRIKPEPEITGEGYVITDGDKFLDIIKTGENGEKTVTDVPNDIMSKMDAKMQIGINAMKLLPGFENLKIRKVKFNVEFLD